MPERTWHVVPGEWTAIGEGPDWWLLIRPDALNAGVPVDVIVGTDPDMLLVNEVTPGWYLRVCPPDPFPACDTRDLSSEYVTRNLRERTEPC